MTPAQIMFVWKIRSIFDKLIPNKKFFKKMIQKLEINLRSG